MTAHILFGATSASGLSLWATLGSSPGAVNLGVPITADFDPVRIGTETLFIGGAGGVPRLFRTDGTAAGTSLVGLPSSAGSITAMAAFDGLAAVATTGADGAGSLWISNGTTSLCISTGLVVSAMQTVGGLLYFTGQSVASDVGSKRLYSSDGTVAGTHRITSQGVPLAADAIAALPGGGLLLENAASGTLWTTTGTAAAPIAPSGLGTVAGPGGFLALDGALLFSFTDATGSMALWRSTGTGAGTQPVPSGGTVFDSIGDLVALGGVALFTATDSNGATGLWRTNGAASTLVGRFADAQDLTAFGGEVAFSALDASGHPQLWISDGTAAGTRMVLPQGASANGLDPVGLFAYFGMIGCTGTDSAGRTSLWLGDGTAAGTTEVAAATATSFQTGTEALAGSGRLVSLAGVAHSGPFAALDGDTVLGGASGGAILAPAGDVSVQGGSGALSFTGGSGSCTVTGGSGACTLFGGAGGGLFSAGSAGGSVLVASGGNTTLTGGGALDRLFGAPAGDTTMVAPTGRESLIGGGGNSVFWGGATAGAVIFTGAGTAAVLGQAEGGDTIVGGSGALQVTSRNGEAVFGGSGPTTVTGSLGGADSIIGGSGGLVVQGRGGNMLVVGGSGAASIAVGNAAALLFQGSGPMAASAGSGWFEVVAGPGAATIGAGSSGVSIDVVKGAAGGSDVVRGFNPAINRIALFGYQASDLHLHAQGGNSTLSVSDGTTITLLGVGNAASAIDRIG
ncbi:beta strand repeat-containing protein [Lichenicoccus sp.]|uniref:beta strand repeat-containing protein n=1 Tax=Lichenicoccus sp. TaxID=2781899 RepID=UPI003D1176E3